MAQTANETDKRIGGIVRARRDALRITQAGLAKSIGVTFQQVQKYERGVNRISASTLLDIAEALNCHVADLYGDPDPKAVTISERSIMKLWQELREPERDAVIALIRAFQKP